MDISLVEVMSALGHQGERELDETLSTTMYYPAHGRRVALSISENKLYTAKGQLLCDHSFDVVMLLMKAERDVDFTEEQALGWLAEKFGEPRALAAYVVRTESRAASHLDLARQEREERSRQSSRAQRSEPERPGREQQRDNNQRPSRGSTR